MIKKLIALTLLCALLFPFTLLSAVAHAAEGTKIATVDIQALQKESDVSKSVQKQLQAQREKFTEELRKKEEKLREQEKKLAAEKSSLSQEEFVKKREEFEGELFKVRKLTQSRKRTLDLARAKAMDKIRVALFNVVQGIADEQKINLVISRQNVVVGETSIDITKEAMKRLNKSLKELKLDFKEDK